MNKIHIFAFLMVIALLASCSGNSFKIDGNIINLDGGAVKIVFQGDSGMVDETVMLDKKGRFSFKGTSAGPVIVSIMNLGNQPLISVVACNGDHIKVKGDGKEPSSIKVKGNKVNEDWQLFRKEHAAFYSDPNPSRLNAAIEKYVREHKDDMLSTVLLMADYSDYSDRDKMVKMIKGLNPEARPESLTKVFPGDPLTYRKNNMPRLMSLTLWKHSGSFEEIKLTDRVVLLSLWGTPQQGRDVVTAKLRDILEEHKGIQLIDILAESDTLQWRNNITGEDWPHYWAPGGPMEQGIQLLGITSLPWYAVTDSTGLIVYSGPSLDDAVKKAK